MLIDLDLLGRSAIWVFGYEVDLPLVESDHEDVVQILLGERLDLLDHPGSLGLFAELDQLFNVVPELADFLLKVVTSLKNG